ncbi:MAG: hypothetical protein L3J93_02665 [Thermoplasmata archaeon]|nr:hypothetical protein [Thermoplasmata archaeon]
MRTYLLLQLDSEGAAYSDIAELLEDLGFQPHTEGGYDFVYEWGREATVLESLEFADRVQAAIRGQRTYFRVESIES